MTALDDGTRRSRDRPRRGRDRRRHCHPQAYNACDFANSGYVVSKVVGDNNVAELSAAVWGYGQKFYFACEVGTCAITKPGRGDAAAAWAAVALSRYYVSRGRSMSWPRRRRDQVHRVAAPKFLVACRLVGYHRLETTAKPARRFT